MLLSRKKLPSSRPLPKQSKARLRRSTGDRRTFWERVFKLAPLRERLEKTLTKDWKFTDVRPRQLDTLLSDEGEEARLFFLNGGNARQYYKLRKEFGCGFEFKDGRIVDDSSIRSVSMGLS
jgi:hypothetical protein